MMEMGNMLFGHSRGEYPIPRGKGWEEELNRLFDTYAPARDNSWREYGEVFENDTFFVFPYYWGDCTCGYETAEWAWSESHQHEPTCYQAAYTALSPKERDTYRDKTIVKALCKRFGIPWNGGAGCAVHCTCSHDRDWAAWSADHTHGTECPTVRPNFCYKPQDFQLMWYKYPLRDSYMNQEITLVDFHVIIDACIASLGRRG